MPNTRKGIFTDDGEKVIDKAMKFKNAIIEAGDGLVISLADNQGLERLKNEAEAKRPGVCQEVIYPIADAFIGVLEAVIEARDAKEVD